jgi:hypothetical protein
MHQANAVASLKSPGSAPRRGHRSPRGSIPDSRALQERHKAAIHGHFTLVLARNSPTRLHEDPEKEYCITLTDAGSEFFRVMCAGRLGDELTFLNAGRDWRKSEQTRPWLKQSGKLRSNLIGFHGLRHTWASLAVMAGMPLLVVAKNLGHSDTRMVEKHYGHLAPSYVAETTRRYAPRFGIAAPSDVTPLTATAHR